MRQISLIFTTQANPLSTKWFCCGLFAMVSLFFYVFSNCVGSQKGPRPKLKAFATQVSLKTSALTRLDEWYMEEIPE